MNSPFSEQLQEKGYEIIYFTDPVDEYVMQNLVEYDDFKFQSASKEDLKLGDKDAKKENKRLKVCMCVCGEGAGGCRAPTHLPGSCCHHLGVQAKQGRRLTVAMTSVSERA